MTSKNKILKFHALKRKITELRQKGRVIAFTNGCFDILHYGHISYLESAKKKDRILIIGLNSDRSVKKIKGPGRPINHELNRAGVLAALSCVDFVTLFDEETPHDLIKAVQPDVLIKGADWKGKGAVGSDIVKARGGKVEFIKYVPNLSTTNTIKKIKKQCQKS
jgi:D-beta-D-heptose 7-phosphate kinase/D-beta-D-heptose 1-phosphate adenosyltransferase